MSSGGPNPTTQGDIAYQEEGPQARPLGVRLPHFFLKNFG